MEQEIMELAEQFKSRNGYSDEKANEVAKLNVELLQRLQEGIVEFFFTKKDGSTRQAFGTLKQDLLPVQEVTDDPKKERKPCPTVQVFYDTEAQAWKCYSKANLIKIVS